MRQLLSDTDLDNALAALRSDASTHPEAVAQSRAKVMAFAQTSRDRQSTILADDPEFSHQALRIDPSPPGRRGRGLLLGAAAGLLITGSVLVPGIFTASDGQAPATGPAVRSVPTGPQVGDCVIGDVRMYVAAPTPDLPFPNPPTSHCSGSRDGEIVSVGDSAPGEAGSSTSADPLVQCRDEAQAYLGVSDPRVAQWSSAVRFGSTVIGPSPDQAAAGQDWTACVVHPTSAAGDPAGGLTGSVSGVISETTIDTAQFGTCLERPGGAASNCTQPHRVEILGVSVVPLDTLEPADFQQSCRDFIRTETLTPDPTGAGVLTIEATVDHINGARDGETLGNLALCAVTLTNPDQVLTNTLRGLGTTPLPLS